MGLFSFLKFIFSWRIVASQYCVGHLIHQHEPVICIHVSPSRELPPTSHPFLPPGCYRALVRLPESYSKFSLAVCFTYGSVCASLLSSLIPSSSSLPSPPVSISLLSVSVSPLLPCTWVHQCHLYRFPV